MTILLASFLAATAFTAAAAKLFGKEKDSQLALAVECAAVWLVSLFVSWSCMYAAEVFRMCQG